MIYYSGMRRRNSLTILSLAVAVLLCLSGCAHASAEPEPPSETQVPNTPEPVEVRPVASPTPENTASAVEIVYRIVSRYARRDVDEESLRKRDILLLRQTDPLAASQWEDILDFYDDAREAEIHYGELPDGLNDTDALCIVVMGYQLNKNGSMKPELTERLKVALKSAEKYPNALLLLSGGGTAENNSRATEAEKMAEWLVGNGLDPGRIIVENRSMSTVENAKCICEELKQYPGIREIAIVSSDYHILRASVLVQARSILQIRSTEEEPLRVVSNAACRTDKKDISDAKIVKSILLLSDDAELRAMVRDNDFSAGGK